MIGGGGELLVSGIVRHVCLLYTHGIHGIHGGGVVEWSGVEEERELGMSLEEDVVESR
jgi:hypothetical protein